MIDNSTLHKLMSLAYHELSEEESIELLALIASNQQLRDEWNQIKQTIEMMDKKTVSPSPKSVQAVLNYGHKKRSELV